MYRCLIFIFLLLPCQAWATTYYVRDGGGTATQCTGTTNATYPGSGSGVACAFNHPAWALGTNINGSDIVAGVMAAGDTLYIDGDSDTSPGTQAQYVTGYTMPNGYGTYCTSNESSGGQGCNLNAPPVGTSTTSIIGTGTHRPQLWGNEAVPQVLNLVPTTPSGSTLTKTSGTGDSTITASAVASSGYIFPVTGVTTSPTVGATYTAAGGNTFTIKSVVISGGTGTLVASSTGVPSSDIGTLTKASGTGDATISFSGETQADYVITVSGVTTSPTAGAVYTSSGIALTVVSSNISSGAGTIQANEQVNFDVENLEITDHSSCGYLVPSQDANVDGFPAKCAGTGGSSPYGPYGKDGIILQGVNITTKNLYVHGMAIDDIYFPGNVSNWNSTNDVFVAGSDFLDDGGNMNFGGNNTMTGDVWAYGGCADHYPLPDAANIKDPANYVNCIDQGGGNLGGGFMMQSDGNATCGNWTIANSQFLFNLKTNIDFLHCNGTGTFNFYRSRTEGSAGEALKLNVGNINIEESQIIGDAPVWEQTPLQNIKSQYNTSGSTSWDYDVCRGGSVFPIATQNNETVNLINDDITGNCVDLVGVVQEVTFANYGCSSFALNAYNTKFLGGYDYAKSKTIDLFYNAGNDGNGGGSCGTGHITPTFTDNGCYNTDGGQTINCSNVGSGTVTSDPKVYGESSIGALTNWVGPTAYYSGTSLGDLLYLQATSPLKAAGSTSGVTYTNGKSNDYNGVVANSPLDIGAIQYGSTITTSTGMTNGFCSISNQCASGNCNASGYCISATGAGDMYIGNLKITGVTLN